jgi:hypothetical protein
MGRRDHPLIAGVASLPLKPASAPPPLPAYLPAHRAHVPQRPTRSHPAALQPHRGRVRAQARQSAATPDSRHRTHPQTLGTPPRECRQWPSSVSKSRHFSKVSDGLGGVGFGTLATSRWPQRGGFGLGTEVARAHKAACWRNPAFTRPLRMPYSAASTLPALRRSTRLAQYGGPRAGVRFGTSVGSPMPRRYSPSGIAKRVGDARRSRDKCEQLHPSAAAWARQHVEPKRPFEKLRPRTIGASPRSLGHFRRRFWRNLRLHEPRLVTAPALEPCEPMA